MRIALALIIAAWAIAFADSLWAWLVKWNARAARRAKGP